jgi:hypothetical protein
MADAKITALANNNTIDEADLLPVVDDVAGTPVTEKRTVGQMKTFMRTKRITSESSSATPTINTDNCDVHRITALAANVTSMTTNLTGTPTSMQVLGIEVTPTATRTVTWGASFESSVEFTLPTEFTGTDTGLYLFYWNTITSKWRYGGKV